MAKTFIRITNQVIYKEICKMHDDIIKINGKTKLNGWISKTALGLITTVIIVLLYVKL